MPVHNAAPYLDEAIESIVSQTHGDFEFVILDDGSTDGSTEILQDWAAKDRRIRLHRQGQKSGPVGSSNLVVSHARGSLIARMDADDRSHPNRLAKQVELLATRDDVGLVGTLCNVIDTNGWVVRGPDFWRLGKRTFFTPFPHGSIMYRRFLFDRVGGYREACAYWEDQDLFLRMARQAGIVTIPLPLYEYRQSPISTRLASDSDIVERSIDLAYRCLNNLRDEQDYEAVLHETTRPSKVDPRVLVSLGSLQLWAGQRPRLFERMLARTDLGPDLKSASALVWALWASLAPGSLRMFMRGLSNLRNRAVPVDRTGDAVAWLMPRDL